MAEPKPALLDGQFEWRYLQRSYEKRQTQETQDEAEPALRALAMMHTRASDTSSSVEDGSNRQSDASLPDDGNDDENVVVEEEEDCDGTAEAPIATAGTPFVHANSVDLSEGDDNKHVNNADSSRAPQNPPA